MFDDLSLNETTSECLTRGRLIIYNTNYTVKPSQTILVQNIRLLATRNIVPVT